MVKALLATYYSHAFYDCRTVSPALTHDLRDSLVIFCFQNTKIRQLKLEGCESDLHTVHDSSLALGNCPFGLQQMPYTVKRNNYTSLTIFTAVLLQCSRSLAVLDRRCMELRTASRFLATPLTQLQGLILMGLWRIGDPGASGRPLGIKISQRFRQDIVQDVPIHHATSTVNHPRKIEHHPLDAAQHHHLRCTSSNAPLVQFGGLSNPLSIVCCKQATMCAASVTTKILT